MVKTLLKSALLLAALGSSAAMARDGDNRANNHATTQGSDGQSVRAQSGGHYGPADDVYGDRWPHYPARPPVPPGLPLECRYGGCYYY